MNSTSLVLGTETIRPRPVLEQIGARSKNSFTRPPRPITREPRQHDIRKERIHETHLIDYLQTFVRKHLENVSNVKLLLQCADAKQT